VVVNLLQNARDAVREAPDGRLRRVRVTTRAIDAKHEAELTVEDSGPGLPAEERHHLFEPLVTGRSGGTGLGLAIVRSLVEAHGGTVEAGDADGGGALFRIRIPTAAQKKEAA
jgi:two-component system NtrC family sensor kinase